MESLQTKIKSLVGKNMLCLAAIGVAVLMLVSSSLFSSSTNSNAKSNTDLEQRLSDILQQAKGVGKLDIMITAKDDGTVEGAVIVAQGAQNAAVRQNISDAAVAVLGVPSYKVQVFACENEKN